jgi:hypothetical protein
LSGLGRADPIGNGSIVVRKANIAIPINGRAGKNIFFII